MTSLGQVKLRACSCRVHKDLTASSGGKMVAYGHVVDGHRDGETVDVERHLLGHRVQVFIVVRVHLHPCGRAGLLCSHGNQGGEEGGNCHVERKIF